MISQPSDLKPRALRRLTTRWLVHCIGGLVLIGAGVSITGHAIGLRVTERSWFWVGTVGLIVLNGGVSVFGQGVCYRARLDAVGAARTGRK